MIIDFPSYSVSIVLQILYIVTTIAGVIVVISGNRNPVKTLAWILLFFLLPFIGIIFYMFFGVDYTRQRMISRRKRRKLASRYSYPFERKSGYDLPTQFQTLAKYLNHQSQFPLFTSNEMSIFESGKEKFEQLIADIEKAKEYIHLQYYIFENDEIGNRIKDTLIAKSKKGVEVLVIVDDVGCWKVPKRFFDEMRNAGIRTATFLEVRFHRLTSKINFRNHRKIVVIDGKIGYSGGMNIADRYVEGVSWGIWKDLHIRIEGNAVEALESAFLIDWYFTTRELLPLKNYFPEGRVIKKGSTNIQFVTGGPFGEWREILNAHLQLIYSAKEYLYIQTPYFLPNESLLSAIQTAALSGVDVRIMLPASSDTKMVHFATLSYIQSVLKAGVKVYFYEAGFLHSKMMVADDYVATVGSTNLDFRSFEHNFEINAFIYENLSALKLKDIFLKDMTMCTKITLQGWAKRPFNNRLKESIMRLFSPLL